MTILNYKLEKFEGPLDLCLSLIQKNKMKIEDIQISVLCDQYMEYINAAQEMDIELSSDFLLTASELMLIKSKMLLPRSEEEEEEDPRMALAAAMMEYQRAKEAAGFLRDMYAEYGMRMGKDTDEISVDKTYVADHDAALLSTAFLRIMSEVRVSDEEAKEKFKPLLNKKTVSVAAIVENLASRLQGGRRVHLHGFFQSAKSRAEIVTMFLALLELLKSGMLMLLDESPEETRSGVIDTAGEVYVKLEPHADISQLTQIIQDE